MLNHSICFLCCFLCCPLSLLLQMFAPPVRDFYLRRCEIIDLQLFKELLGILDLALTKFFQISPMAQVTLHVLLHHLSGCLMFGPPDFRTHFQETHQSVIRLNFACGLIPALHRLTVPSNRYKAAYLSLDQSCSKMFSCQEHMLAEETVRLTQRIGGTKQFIKIFFSDC